VIIAHNHPSGNLKPSAQDEIITKKVKEVLALIDVKLMDHFILTEDAYVSFAEEGLC
jgi:DNA repair protein RadC